MDWGLIVPMLIIIFVLGMAAGSAIEAASWRRNAEDHIRRKRSGGRVFKVSHSL